MSTEAIPLRLLESRSRVASRSWDLRSLQGRLVELSSGPASASLSLTFRLVVEAQRLGEPVVWVGGSSSSFFPPDVARAGVDLAALAVIRVPRRPQGSGVFRAAELLVRSGGFGLVVIDVPPAVRVPLAIQSRLAGLTKRHHAALLLLTEKSEDSPSLGPLVSLRAATRRWSRPGEPFECEVRVLKDKRGGSRWRYRETRHGPPGLS
jgi:recombination protein RecA